MIPDFHAVGVRLRLADRTVLALSVALAFAAMPARAQAPAERVVVTATRSAEELSSLPFGVSVITAGELARSGATTVNEALMRLLGITGRMDLAGGGEYQLDLRGYGVTAGQNQVVMIDGMRVNEADLGTTRLAGVAIDAIERIEVLRGSGAVLYGEGATGGVIHIVTRAGRGHRQADGGEVLVGFGSDHLRQLRGNVHANLGELTLEASGSRKLSDGHRDNFASGVSTGALAAQWQRGAHRVALRHAQDEVRSGWPGALTADQYAADPAQASSPSDWGRSLGRRTTLQAQTRVAGWTLSADGGLRAAQQRSASHGYDHDVDAREVGLRAQHESVIAPGLRHAVTFGNEHQWWKRDIRSYPGIARQSSHAWFLRDVLKLPQGTEFSVGARWNRSVKSLLDDYSSLRQDDRSDVWELGVIHPLGANLRAFGRMGTSWRLANADEFSFTQPGVLLRPQRSRDVELGLRWAQGGDRAEVRVFRSRLRDEIGYDPTVANSNAWNGSGANVNFDPTRRRGVEFEGTRAVSRTLDLRATLAWREATFTRGAHAGKDVPLVPSRSASVGTFWKLGPLGVPGGQQTLGASVRHQGGTTHPDIANACRVPGHTVLDARWAWAVSNVEWAVDVSNLTDRRYYTQAYGCEVSTGRTTSIYPESGRAVGGSARIAF
ncbi:MAG: hypothetical protein RIQ53_921 [Pseudomonadota bacterium]|jgi:iron complex outermembrane receptor protein